MARPNAAVAQMLDGGRPPIVQMTAGEAITAGYFVTLESDSKLDEIDSGDPGLHGLAITGAAADGDTILVCLALPNVVFSVASATATGTYDDVGDLCDIGATSLLDLAASTDDLFRIIAVDGTESASRYLVTVNGLQSTAVGDPHSAAP
jgi:hypothetical protein